ERDVIPELADTIDRQIDRLGPGTDLDPYAGSEETLGVVASSLVYDNEVMDRMPRVEVIARTGIGVDLVDIDAATKRGVVVCNTPDAPTVSTAEHAMALMLSVSKNILESARRLRSGESDLYARHQAIELDGKTLGLVGFGRIARRVAILSAALGMAVVAYDPYLSSKSFFIERVDSLHSLLGRSDIVSVHVPLTEESRGMFGSQAFAAMKPGSIFINTARGGLVDQQALIEGIDRGHVRSAGLDVTDPEPLPSGHPLLNRPDVVVTPHVGSGTYEGKRRIFMTAVAEVVAVLRGERPDHMVNPEVWDRRHSGHPGSA
ncbi:MAG: hydroxyacid dehydrogenase, partial [Actinobacteria bacterium]|nr:hydroxyacid dehydrogenase [Actinomycetota bacterium]